LGSIRGSLAILTLVVAGTAISSCGGGSSSSSTPTTPSSSGSPSATPAPTPTPSSGGSSTLPRSCARGAQVTSSAASCEGRSHPVLRPQLQTALDAVWAKGTEIFYEDGKTIRYVDKFREELVKALDSQGICAIFDYGNVAGDEIYLRSADGALSEVWDIISSNGEGRLGYISTCEPALSFPDPGPAPVNQDPTCTIPPSDATFCLTNAFASVYYGDVRASIEQLTKEKPEIFNFQDQTGAELSYGLNDPEAYTRGVVANLRKRGYCALDGEELAVKKERTFNENFDIIRHPSTGGVYSGISYRGKCHNSLF
jgi:hypothetical protein